MEEITATHPAVAECAAIGIVNDLKGKVPLALTVTKPDNEIAESVIQDDIIKEVIKIIGNL